MKKTPKNFSFQNFAAGLPKLTTAGKRALLKYSGLLLIILLLFTFLSRVLGRNGQTLAQYGEANPSLQNGSVSGNDNPLPEYADNGNLSEPADSQSDNNPAESADSQSNGSNIPAWAVSEDGLTGNGGTESPDRITYKPDFYYEPLSENLITYITGSSYPADGSAQISLSELNFVHILHYNFDGEISEGELICNNAIAQDLVEIFYELYVAEYQLEKVVLIDYYDADDTTSMVANNTSCFNYRNIDDTDNLSRHAFGLAIDVNPFYNPYIRFTKDGGQIVSPESSEAYADRTQNFPYKIDADDLCCRLFLEHGFTWGGNWNSSKDYQHFQKIIN
ncbi:MAG: M15 family metallopeptidase [Lachnospiraceae bacterium]|nr:M15 family metallopeptidase [Lachnospiraceae bacterium]